eukprot:scaffold141621_cov139-Phaeocystis_antarctica.AAC.1
MEFSLAAWVAKTITRATRHMTTSAAAWTAGAPALVVPRGIPWRLCLRCAAPSGSTPWSLARCLSIMTGATIGSLRGSQSGRTLRSLWL